MKESQAVRRKAEVVALLTGYAEPSSGSVSSNPIGENGLILRIRNINYLSCLLDELDKPQTIRLFSRQSLILFETLRWTCHNSFTTEYLQVMDHPRSKGRENLTVELCHEYYQACSEMTPSGKEKEDVLLRTLKKKHIGDGILEFRNTAYFHLDKLTTCSAPGISRGSRREMVALLLEWFDHIVTSVYGSSPLFVTKGAIDQAHAVGRDLRRVMLYSLRYGRNRFQRREIAFFETPAQWFERTKVKPEDE